MSAPPIHLAYHGEGLFMAAKRDVPVCMERFGQGEIVLMAPVEDRSRRSHDHFFATMDDLWETLPEHLGAQYPTAASFRKRALISTGHCDTRTTVCATKAEALRLVALAEYLAPESVATLNGAVVTVYTAHSQSLKAMGKAKFQQSKEDCLGWAEGIVGQGAGGANNPARVAA